MMKKTFQNILVILFILIYSDLKGQYDLQDSTNLKAFWIAMNGPNWTVYDWTGPISTWEGLTWDQERLDQIILRNDFEIIGTIPEEFGNLSAVTSITMINPTIQGTLPESMNNMTKLKSIYIQNRNADNSQYVLPDLSGCTSLERIRLQLYNIQLDGWPDWLQNLIDIQLGQVIIEEEIPQWLAEKEDLQVLYLGENNLTGTIPEFSGQTNLQFFGIENQNFDPQPFPSWVQNQTALTGLTLGNLELTSNIPNQFFSNFPNLQRIRLSELNVSQDINEILGSDMNQVISLDLGNNMLFGHLPSAPFDPSNLSTLNFFNNRLSGIDDFSEFNNLSRFLMTDNQIPHEHFEVVYNNLASLLTNSTIKQSYGEVDQNELPQDSFLILDAISSGQHDTYQWYKDNQAITNATSKEFQLNWTADATGNYHCMITNTLMDITSSTARINVQAEELTSASDIDKTDIHIYPNPATSSIQIEGSPIQKVEIYDLQGRQLGSFESSTLDISYLSAGHYLFKIRKGKEVINRLFQKIN